MPAVRGECFTSGVVRFPIGWLEPRQIPLITTVTSRILKTTRSSQGFCSYPHLVRAGTTRGGRDEEHLPHCTRLGTSNTGAQLRTATPQVQVPEELRMRTLRDIMIPPRAWLTYATRLHRRIVLMGTSRYVVASCPQQHQYRAPMAIPSLLLNTKVVVLGQLWTRPDSRFSFMRH